MARYLTFLLLWPGLVFAQATDLRLPISLDADSTYYDGKNSMLMFQGLRLSQGCSSSGGLSGNPASKNRQIPP